MLGMEGKSTADLTGFAPNPDGSVAKKPRKVVLKAEDFPISFVVEGPGFEDPGAEYVITRTRQERVIMTKR